MGVKWWDFDIIFEWFWGSFELGKLDGLMVKKVERVLNKELLMILLCLGNAVYQFVHILIQICMEI